MWRGGTNVVDLEPEPEPEEEEEEDCLLSREVMERIVLMDPVGECVADWSGIVIDRSSASLQLYIYIYKRTQFISIHSPPKKKKKPSQIDIDLPNSTNPPNPLSRTLSRKPLNPIPIK